MRLFTIFRIAMAACAFCTGAARAADQAANNAGLTTLNAATAAPIEPYTNERETQTFTVNADGSYTKIDEMTLRVNNEAGVARVAQYYIWFNRNMASVDVLEAYTTSADGTRHDVRPEQIRDVQEARSFDAPMFQDILEKVIVFPAVEPGARVHLKYRKTQMQPIVPGHFSDFTPPDLAPTHNFRLVYDLPAGKPLYADARGFTALPPSTKNGRTRYEFRYDKAHFARLEYGSIAYVSYGDRLMVSTFPDYAAFAAKCNRRTGPLAHRRRSDAACKSQDALQLGPQECALRRRQYRTRRGRAASRDGNPRAALWRLQGPCRAVWRAARRRRYSQRARADQQRHDLHAARRARLRRAESRDHVAARASAIRRFDRAERRVRLSVLSRTPSTATMSRITDLSINVAHDGSATFVYRLESAGWAAEQGRALLRMQTPAQREESLQAELRFVNLSGTATLSTSNLNATDGPLSLTMKGKLEDFVVPGTAASIPALTSFVGGFQSDARYWLGERQRTQPFVCRNVELHERSQIALPANFRVLDVPEAMAARDRFIDYRSTYSYDASANVITVTRDGTTRFGSEVCSPEDFTQMRAGIETIGRDVRAQVIVRSTVADAARGASSTLSVPSRVIAGSPARAQSAD